MANGAAFWRIIKLKSSDIGGVGSHILRSRDDEGVLRTKSNKDIHDTSHNVYRLRGYDGIGGGYKRWYNQDAMDDITRSNPHIMRDLISARIADANAELASAGLPPIRVRRDSVRVIEIVVDVPQSWYDSNDNKYRQYYGDAIRFFDSWLGADNRIVAAEHVDERSGRPHYHLWYVPITPDLRLCAKDLTSRAMLRDMQAKYYDQVSSRYGMAKPDHGNRRHIDTNVYKAMMADIDDLRNNINQQAVDIIAAAEVAAAKAKKKIEREAEEEAEEKLKKIREYLDDIRRVAPKLTQQIDDNGIDSIIDIISDFKKRFGKEAMRNLSLSRTRLYRALEDEMLENLKKYTEIKEEVECMQAR